MKIQHFESLKENVVGIEKVLEAPDHMSVIITTDNGGLMPAITAGQLRVALENSVYDHRFGWQFLFPGEEKDPGCYQGFSNCSYYWATIVEPDFCI